MRFKTFILITLFPFLTQSQDFEIQESFWQYKVNSQNRYVNLLKLNDSKAIIIKVGYSSYWAQGTDSNFIVYNSDNSIKRFKVFEPYDLKSKVKIRRKRLKKKDYASYHKNLQRSIDANFLNIDKSKLNLQHKTVIEDGEEITIRKKVVDGVKYHFEIYQSGRESLFRSYAPRTFIEAKFPGWEHRKKLIELMSYFEELIIK